MAAAQGSKHRIVEVGADLMSRRGLSGVTLGVLADEVGMSKSGLFAHFRSKDAIEIAILDHRAAAADRTVVEPAAGAPAGLPRLVAMMVNWLGWTARAGLRGGCPVAAGIFELDDASGEVRERLERIEAHWRDELVREAVEAVRAGQLSANADADQLVFELFGLYLGHHAAKRFVRDPKADERALMALIGVLGRYGAQTGVCRDLVVAAVRRRK